MRPRHLHLVMSLCIAAVIVGVALAAPQLPPTFYKCKLGSGLCEKGYCCQVPQPIGPPNFCYIWIGQDSKECIEETSAPVTCPIDPENVLACLGLEYLWVPTDPWCYTYDPLTGDPLTPLGNTSCPISQCE